MHFKFLFYSEAYLMFYVEINYCEFFQIVFLT